MLVYWEISAKLVRDICRAEIKIPLNSFLNGYKIIETKIVDDTIIIKLNHKTEPQKILSNIKPSQHKIN